MISGKSSARISRIFYILISDISATRHQDSRAVGLDVLLYGCQDSSLCLWLALALNILLGEEVLTVKDDIAEVANPVAKNDDTRLMRQLQVDINMAMTVDEIVDVGVVLDVLLGIEDEVFTVFAHIGGLLTVRSL